MLQCAIAMAAPWPLTRPLLRIEVSARLAPVCRRGPGRGCVGRECTPSQASLRRGGALRRGASPYSGLGPRTPTLRWTADASGSCVTRASEQEEGQVADAEDWFEDDDVTLLHSERSDHNHIKVLEVARFSDHPLAGARVLLLDAPGNIHSIYFKYKPWTDSYYDRFAALPPLIPPGGPIGILGLAAGSAVRTIAYAWPDVHLEAWEYDPAVIQVARDFFDLRELEVAQADEDSQTDYNPLLPVRRGSRSRLRGGVLRVHEGDALGEGAQVAGGFSGLVVDLFAKGVVVPQLTEEVTWQRLLARLRPGGRVMINAGGGCVESESGDTIEGERVMWASLLALRRALPEGEELMCRRLEGEGGNVLGLTVGAPSDLQRWLDCDLPAQVVDSLDEWVPFEEFIQTQIVSLEDAS